MKQKLLTLLLALVSATAMWATDYDLWINGVRVTSANADDLSVINGVTGQVAYIAPDNTLYVENMRNTLFLTNASITSEQTVVPLVIRSGASNLKIKLSGINTIQTGGAIGTWFEDCGDVEISENGILNIKANDYAIFFKGKKLTIKDRASVFLQGGGIENDGNNDETLAIDNASLFVPRPNPSLSSIYMRNLEITNAHLLMPSWSSYEWSGAELTNGSLLWYDDIYIKAGKAVSYSGTYGDMNHDGSVTLADLTTLANMLIGKKYAGMPTVDHSGFINGHKYVDLGLPSGTMWATCNVGASRAEDIGNFYAWGEIETKSSFNWASYQRHGNIDDNGYVLFKKYCSDINIGCSDGLTELEDMDDVAYKTWGANWRIPTREQMRELVNSNYVTMEFRNMNGMDGVQITSKINGNSIFMPYTGYYENGSIVSLSGYNGYYWSRSLDPDDPYKARGLRLYDSAGKIYWNINTSYRYYGMPIRPVRVNNE